MPATSQTDIFQKPADYWLRRAQKCSESGDLRRAAVLFRHAARIAPESLQACMSYANALRDLHCYEASNREAIGAAAAHPFSRLPLGLMSRNYLSLGMHLPAADAYTLYIKGMAFEDLPLWDEEDDETEEELFSLPPVRRRARLAGLLKIALQRTAMGDLPRAKKALDRTKKPPYEGLCVERDHVEALYYEVLGQKENALVCAWRVMSMGRVSPSRMATLACTLMRLGKAKAAAGALLKAAIQVRYHTDECMVCMAADQLHMLPTAQAMLVRNLRREPDRLPTCYNLAVCLIKQGDMESASRYLHLCREIDPDDLSTELLFTKVDEWSALEKQELIQAAWSIAFYGAFRTGQISEILTPILTVLRQGEQAFAKELETNQKLYRRFVDALTLPIDGLALVLPPLVDSMPPELAQRLLRELLLSDCNDSDLKKIAMYELERLGAKPPVALHQGERIARIDPSAPPPEHPDLLRRMLFKQIQRAMLIDRNTLLVPYGVQAVRRLSKKQRMAMARDKSSLWPAALCVAYAMQHGTKTRVSELSLSRPKMKQLFSAAHALSPRKTSKEAHHEAD